MKTHCFVVVHSHRNDLLCSRHNKTRRSPPTGRIPDGYKTYSLFLICNSRWLSADKEGDLGDLYRQFNNFGLTIGDKNLAVWFWKGHRDGKGGSSKMVEDFRTQDVDVARSSRFCEKWNLPPSAGPYLVIVGQYPTESPSPQGLPKERARFALGV